MSARAAAIPRLNVAARVPRTEAEGPGVRYALWVQGCPFRCPDCCNPHMLEFRDAEWIGADAILAEILATNGVEGATFIGGEPFAQADVLAFVARGLRDAGLSTMIFTGYELERLRAANRADWNALLDATDLLVDGLYRREEYSTRRRWIGSENQGAHFLSDRYARLSDDRDGWPSGDVDAAERNTIELRLSGGRVSVNGFPHDDVAALIADLAARSIGPARRSGSEA
jgi:anaerobic ribonucleoside-triphosphate reductase activating protein